MTDSRAPESPDVRAFDTTVEAIDGNRIDLAETYFYPEGGGQPADRGRIDGVPVVDVQQRAGSIVHVLDAEPDLAVGDTVECTIDDGFRTYCMRAHTASHVVYGAGRRLFDDLGYAGFDIGERKVRIDLTTAEPIDEADLVELGRLTKRAVWDGRPVTWQRLPAEEARSLDGIAFNERTEDGAMATTDSEVRVVTVGSAGIDSDDATAESAEPWDVAACGGTHVSNTRRIGPIEPLDRSNPGENVTRIEFAVGPTAIDHAVTAQTAAREASQRAGVPIGELPATVERFQDEQARLEAELERREHALLAARLDAVPTTSRDGLTWAIGAIDGIDPNVIREGTQSLVGEDTARPDVVAIVDRAETPAVVVASTGAVDAGAVIDDVTDTFGGGGGGGPTVAQGGGLAADPEEVVDYLRTV